MKKIASLCLAAVFLVLAAGCSGAPQKAELEKINQVMRENEWEQVLKQVDSLRMTYRFPEKPGGDEIHEYQFSNTGEGIEYSYRVSKSNQKLEEYFIEGNLYYIRDGVAGMLLPYEKTAQERKEYLMQSGWIEEDASKADRNLTEEPVKEGILYTLTYPCDTEYLMQSGWWGAQQGDTFVEKYLVGKDGLLLQNEIGYLPRDNPHPNALPMTVLSIIDYEYNTPMEIPEAVSSLRQAEDVITVTLRGAQGNERLPTKQYQVPKGNGCYFYTQSNVFWDAAQTKPVEGWFSGALTQDTVFYFASRKIDIPGTEQL